MAWGWSLGWALSSMASLIAAVWRTDGVSEFVAALIGGGFALAAQQMAVLHERKQAEARAKDEAKAHAWAIFFKLNEVNEVLSHAASIVADARAAANQMGVELWQTLQFTPHDHREFSWETQELVLLIDHKKLTLMTEYQQAMLWLANFIQSAQLYREMRIGFLTSHPGSIIGQSGTMNLTREQYEAAMPTIVHLRTLADSLEDVVTAQARDMRTLLLTYAATMKEMIGMAPQLEFPKKQGLGNGQEPSD